MITVFAQLTMQGEKFSPLLASKRLRIRLRDPVEPGQIMRSGRYKDRPSPDGRARYFLANGNLDRLLKNLPALAANLRAQGAEDLTLFVDIEYEAQCNWELTPHQLQQLANAEVPLGVSCYPKDPIPVSAAPQGESPRGAG